MSEELKSSKVLIAVVTCPANKDKIAAQQATWIPAIREQGYTVEIFDGQRLGVSDDYLELPHKTKAICQWALEHEYTSLLKIDDDGYIRVNKFYIPTVAYGGVKNAPNDYGWNGTPNIPSTRAGTHPHPYCSGGGYWLSDTCIRSIAEADITDWAEDRWVGNTLGRAGIQVSVLPGYMNIMGTIHDFLVKDAVVLLQLTDSNDMSICHSSTFENIVRPMPRIIPNTLAKTVQRVPSAARFPRNMR